MEQTTLGRRTALIVLLLSSTLAVGLTGACRVNSENLKQFARSSIESLLNVEQLRSIYWPIEPLEASLLARAIGINVTSAETHFQLGALAARDAYNEIEREPDEISTSNSSLVAPLLHDLFITCSVDRDRVYSLLLNAELNNPFEMIEAQFEMPGLHRRSGLFRIHLSQSTFLVNLRQRFKYDECLNIKYVQLAPNVSYSIECVHCDPEQQEHLDKIFNKRMVRLDSELDSLLSEKLLLGLHVLLNQQRLELDSYLE